MAENGETTVLAKDTLRWRAELLERLASDTPRKIDYPMRDLTTLRIGGPADIYLEPISVGELQKVLTFCSENAVPIFLMGRGSNLLVRDGGIRGVVCSLRHPSFSYVELQGRRSIKAGAGATLWSVSQFAQTNGLSGFEFMEGIPGTLGGGLRMNAGAYKSCMFDVVESIQIMELGGEVKIVEAADIEHRYRCCPLLEKNILLSAVLHGYMGDSEQIRNLMDELREKRLTSQTHSPSAGCTFKNPPGHSAGQLIDSLNLKGTSVGGAQVSDKHANFLINKNRATASDVLNLIAMIQDRVKSAYNLDLETEVMIVGEDLKNEN